MTYLDLADAVAERIGERWPRRLVYRDVCPADFERPSFFLQVLEAEPSDANAVLVRWTVRLLLVVYDEKDDYYVTSSERLMKLQQELLRLFGAGWLRVDGRAVRLSATAVGREPGEAFLEFNASWLAPRETDAAPPVADVAEHYRLTFKEKE